MKGRTKVVTNTTVINTSATQAERNHTRAGQCNSGLRAKSLTFIIKAVVHAPPPSGGRENEQTKSRKTELTKGHEGKGNDN